MRDRAMERLPKLAAAADRSPIEPHRMARPEMGHRRRGHRLSIRPRSLSRILRAQARLGLSVSRQSAPRIRRRAWKKCIVIEELDDFLEEHIRALGIDCLGKEFVPRTGELSVTRLEETRAKLEGRTFQPVCGVAEDARPERFARPAAGACAAGCPHRGLYYALTKVDVVVAGDIGCYSLGTLKPLDRMDTLLCMGAGISVAHGMQKAGEPKKVMGIVGDSTFFHSGITGLLDIGYNNGKAAIIVVDNRITAMTGHQEHPGTGKTLMAEESFPASIEAFGRACGIQEHRDHRSARFEKHDEGHQRGGRIGRVVADHFEPAVPVAPAQAVRPVRGNRRGALQRVRSVPETRLSGDPRRRRKTDR